MSTCICNLLMRYTEILIKYYMSLYTLEHVTQLCCLFIMYLYVCWYLVLIGEFVKFYSNIIYITMYGNVSYGAKVALSRRKDRKLRILFLPFSLIFSTLLLLRDLWHRLKDNEFFAK